MHVVMMYSVNAEDQWKLQMWANAQRDAHYYMPCNNAAKTRNQLKFGGVLQTNETISATSGLKFTILWEHL